VTPLILQLRRNAAKGAAVISAALITAGLSVVPSAGADQLANERAYAQELTNQIAALGLREAALGEQYDAGVVALRQADSRVAAAARALASAKSDQLKTVVLLRQDAVQAYVGGGPALELAGPVALANLNQALLRQELEQTFASHETDALDRFQFAAAAESTAQASLTIARNADRRRLAGLERDRQQVMAAQNNLVGVQQQVKGQIASLVAEIQREEQLAAQRAEDARLARERAAQQAAAAQAVAQAAAQQAAQQQAAAQAAAQQAAQQAAQDVVLQQQEQQQAAEQAAAQTRQAAAIAVNSPVASVTTTVPVESSPVPNESSAAATAVAAAESRVGDPYVWGAAGPGAFDCSGLVMWAYEQAGISLPHFSGAQFADTTQIPMSDLQPGDLVFPADPGQHVAMYVGNGEVVQAPYSGADVQIIPLSGFFVLASRVG
jgi:cell wall-associated NlpC family hydrolase